MSIEAMNHVWKNTTYQPGQTLILLAIADVVNDTHGNRFFMSIPALAAKTKCSDRTVQRTLSQFVEDGWLSVEVEGSGRGNTTEYRFHLLKGDNLTPITEERVTNRAVKGDKRDFIPLLELNRTQVGFDEFWKIYPIHNGGEKNCRKAFLKAAKEAKPEVIIAGALRYRDDPNRRKDFTAYPATWLNQQRWDDPPLPSQSLKTGARSLITTPTIVPPRFDPDEFARKPLDPKKVAEIRKVNGV